MRKYLRWLLQKLIFMEQEEMLTKLQAAEIAAGSGCNTIICKGTIKNPIKNYFNKCYGTKFSNNKYGTSFKKVDCWGN